MLNTGKALASLRSLVVMVLSLVSLVGPTTELFAAASPQERWTQALSAYDAGDYEKAVTQLTELTNVAGANGHLYYNLGNAYYRLGQKGKAMASYLEARRLLPRDPDVHANLVFVHESLPDRLAIEKPAGLLGVMAFWLERTTPRELLLVALLLWACGMTLLLLALWLPKFPLGRLPGALSLGAALLCGGAWTLSAQEEQLWGAVTSPQAAVKSGPGEHNTVVFELHEGAPFVAELQENGWYRISLSDGKKGWIAGQEALVWGLPLKKPL